jgi:hypothetical protein
MSTSTGHETILMPSLAAGPCRLVEEPSSRLGSKRQVAGIKVDHALAIAEQIDV